MISHHFVLYISHKSDRSSYARYRLPRTRLKMECKFIYIQFGLDFLSVVYKVTSDDYYVPYESIVC